MSRNSVGLGVIPHSDAQPTHIEAGRFVRGGQFGAFRIPLFPTGTRSRSIYSKLFPTDAKYTAHIAEIIYSNRKCSVVAKERRVSC